MAWVDRYGGLTFNATRTEQSESGTKQVSYPVSHVGSDPDCFENDTYLQLVPNSKYMSVSYFEQIGDTSMIISANSRRHKMYDFNATLRLVVWLNLHKIGINDPTLTADFKLQTLNRLQKKHPTTTEVQQLQIANVFVDSKTTTVDLFNQYSYDNVQKLVLFPYDVFSVRFDVQWKTPLECVTDVVPGTPITC